MLCHGLDFDDTHSDSVSHVSTVTARRRWPSAEAHGSPGSEVLAAIVGGDEVITRLGMAASGRFHARGFHPTAICGIFGATAARRPADRRRHADGGERARHRGLDGLGPLRLPRGRHGDEADPPGLGGARRHPRGAAGRARRRRPAVGRRGQVRALPRLPRRRAGRDRPRRAARRPRLALGDAPHRLQAVPGLPLHARLARRRGRRARRADARAGGDRRRSSSPCPAAGVSLVLEPAEAKKAPRTDYEGKFSLQYSVASMLVRGHVAVADFSDEAIADPAVLAVAPEGQVRDAGLPDLSAGVPRRRPRHARATARRSSATSRTRRAVPRTRCRPDEVREKFRANAALALAADMVDALEDAILAFERQDDSRPPSRRSRRRSRSRRDAWPAAGRAAGDRRRGPRLRRPGRDPGRLRARPPRRVPDGARRDDEGARPVRRPRSPRRTEASGSASTPTR